MIYQNAPVIRPANPRFSSGPCAKRPGWFPQVLENALVGYSHRGEHGKARLKRALDRTRDILGVPEDYRIAIVPASDTGAVEMALWSLLGARGVDIAGWESFGSGWITDVVKQLKLTDVRRFEADYGRLPDFDGVDFDRDFVFTWNGTTSGVRVPNADFIPHIRGGLTICDATSAAFAMDLDFSKLDVTTFSWQKALGGEGAHGMLVLSPRAVERLESYDPPWPMPKLFRMTSGGKLNEALFEGATINTPSLLCVEDYLDALEWADEIGGVHALIDRATENARILWDFVDSRDWIENLAVDPATRSTSSVCLRFTEPEIKALKAEKQFSRDFVKLLFDEKAAFDIAPYRDAPPGLRIWTGATIERADLEALLPWLDWAYEVCKSNLLAGARRHG